MKKKWTWMVKRKPVLILRWSVLLITLSIATIISIIWYYYIDSTNAIVGIIFISFVIAMCINFGLDTLFKHEEVSDPEEWEKQKKRENIIESKRKIHKLTYPTSIKRCTLFNRPLEKCAKEDKIKNIVKKPKLMGFFMFQFPNRDQNKDDQMDDEVREFYKQYSDEIDELKKIIENFNQSNDLIQIMFPDEATDTLIKTCSFCEIARSYDFGILLMTPPNTNAFLEAGMFMSLGKRVIFLNNDLYPVKPSFDTTSYFYIHYNSINQIEERWNKKMPEFFDEMLNYYLDL